MLSRIGLFVGAVITLSTLVTHVLVKARIERESLETLENYAIERVHHEQELFELTESIEARLAAEYRTEHGARAGDLDASFAERFVRGEDGITRDRAPRLGDPRSAQAWIGREVELDTSLRRELVIGHDLVQRYGPGLELRFINVYFAFPANALTFYWPAAADWSTRVDPGLDIHDEEFFAVATPARDPSRETVWTGVYRDHYGPWMVSCETPIDIGGRHVASVGMDITLDKLLDSGANETLPGTHNLILRDDGRVIMHPELYADHDDVTRDLAISTLDDPGLAETLRLAQSLGPGEHLAVNEVTDEHLAITRLAGPGWYFIVVLPERLVDDQARGPTRAVLVIGLISLLVEILLVYLVLRRAVARPLTELTEASEALARGRRDAPLPTARRDELGDLANSFGRMRDAVAAKTDELEAEAAVRRESEQRLQAILDHTPAIVFIKDLDGRYLLTNRRWFELFGSHPEDEGLRDEDFLPPETAAEMVEHDLQVLLGGEPIQFEERVPHGGGEGVYITVKFPLPGPDGSPGAICGIATDISARIELEDQLRHSQKMDALGQLAGGVAHDFNNLLTVILGQSELLRDELDGSARADVEVIIETAERARWLTRQLLAFSRRELYNAEVFDLCAVVEQSRVLLRRLLPEDIEIELALPRAALRVRADRGQIEQLILNLATNARDAMPEGGHLRLELARVELGPEDERGVPPGAYARLSVRDTGVGMDEATRAKAMEPFFTTKETDRGTGLGLAIVYGVVKQTGGAIVLDSAPGEGTRVDVHLPLTEASADHRGPITTTEIRARAGETILVLEDAATVARVTARSLEGRGYTVLLADRGRRAVELARDHDGPIHLILSDILLPGLSGPEAAAEIRALRPEIAVVFMTGHIDDGRVSVDALGADADVIEKPFRLRELAARIRAALDDAGRP